MYMVAKYRGIIDPGLFLVVDASNGSGFSATNWTPSCGYSSGLLLLDDVLYTGHADAVMPTGDECNISGRFEAYKQRIRPCVLAPSMADLPFETSLTAAMSGMNNRRISPREREYLCKGIVAMVNIEA